MQETATVIVKTTERTVVYKVQLSQWDVLKLGDDAEEHCLHIDGLVLSAESYRADGAYVR